MEDAQKYQITRFSYDGSAPKLIKRGLTLAEAQAHCRDPKTHVHGVWVDGYQKDGAET